MRIKSYYTALIQGILDDIGHPDCDPRHIEAYIRVCYRCLDGLSNREFRREVKIGVECIKLDGIENAESLARTYNL